MFSEGGGYDEGSSQVDHLARCFSMMIRMQENPALILVMVQKSGDYQLRLVVYPILYRVLYIPVGSRQRGTEIGRSIFSSIFWAYPRF